MKICVGELKLVKKFLWNEELRKIVRKFILYHQYSDKLFCVSSKALLNKKVLAQKYVSL